jgi:hypothetical protein
MLIGKLVRTAAFHYLEKGSQGISLRTVSQYPMSCHRGKRLQFYRQNDRILHELLD